MYKNGKRRKGRLYILIHAFIFLFYHVVSFGDANFFVQLEIQNFFCNPDARSYESLKKSLYYPTHTHTHTSMVRLDMTRRAVTSSNIFALSSRFNEPRLYFRGDDQSTNTTRVGITGNGDGSHDYRLTGLRKYTQYSIVVKAFNSKGDGPGSEVVMAHTYEDGE